MRNRSRGSCRWTEVSSRARSVTSGLILERLLTLAREAEHRLRVMHVDPPGAGRRRVSASMPPIAPDGAATIGRDARPAPDTASKLHHDGPLATLGSTVDWTADGPFRRSRLWSPGERAARPSPDAAPAGRWPDHRRALSARSGRRPGRHGDRASGDGHPPRARRRGQAAQARGHRRPRPRPAVPARGPGRDRPATSRTSSPVSTPAPTATSRTWSWSWSMARTWPPASVVVAASPRGPRPASGSMSRGRSASRTFAASSIATSSPATSCSPRTAGRWSPTSGSRGWRWTPRPPRPAPRSARSTTSARSRRAGTTTTPASDVYGLGLVLYESVTGERPWSGDTTDAIALARVGHTAPDVRDRRPEVPAALAAIIARALVAAADGSLSERRGDGRRCSSRSSRRRPVDADGDGADARSTPLRSHRREGAGSGRSRDRWQPRRRPRPRPCVAWPIAPASARRRRLGVAVERGLPRWATARRGGPRVGVGRRCPGHRDGHRRIDAGRRAALRGGSRLAERRARSERPGGHRDRRAARDARTPTETAPPTPDPDPDRGSRPRSHPARSPTCASLLRLAVRPRRRPLRPSRGSRPVRRRARRRLVDRRPRHRRRGVHPRPRG